MGNNSIVFGKIPNRISAGAGYVPNRISAGADYVANRISAVAGYVANRISAVAEAHTAKRYPEFGPWADDSGINGITWIKLEVNEVTEQKTLGRGSGQISLKKLGVEYKFMAPNEIMESIQHQWEDYDNMNAKISNALITGNKALSDFASTVKDALGTAIDSNSVEGFLSGRRGATVVLGQKVDTPIVYKNSSRREYTLEFELIAYSDAYSDVYKPVEELRYYSCPGLGGKESGSIKFSTPYVFKVTSGSKENTSNFLFISVAALVSLQPTFKGPYMNGYPSHCTLQLTFREIPPLFRENFYNSPNGPGGYVSTS